MKIQIGYYKNTRDGRKFVALKKIDCKTDAEAESYVDGLVNFTPLDEDGILPDGLYIRRGTRTWYRRFSRHVYAAHPKSAVHG